MSNNEKKITLSFDLGQVANDILTKCNLISKAIKDEALEDIRASVQEPDSPETHSIINRSITEAFGNVKVACQRYLHVGRVTDNNDLEQMVSSISYVTGTHQVPVLDTNNEPVLDENQQPTYTEEAYTTDEIDTITYETIELELFIPNFNTSVTDALKSQIHKYVVDYTMGRFLQDLVSDKSKEYKDLADEEDFRRILHLVNTRESYHSRKPSWI